MAKIEIIKESGTQSAAQSKTDAVLGIHQTLSKEERKQLASVRMNDKEQVEAAFKTPDYTMTVSDKAYTLEGEVTPKNIDTLMSLAAKDSKEISVKADSKENEQQAWLAAQDYLLDVKNIQPTSETVEKMLKDVAKLQAMGPFFANAKKITVHPGSLAPKKTPIGERFLNTITKKIGLVGKALKPAADFYNRHKTVMNLGGMGLGFVLMGPIGTTLYSQIDKARRAHVFAQERRKERQDALKKLAAFAEKGLKAPKDIRKKARKGYTNRPYVRFAGHLATRLVATVALTAAAGPVVGVLASAIITTGKTVYDTQILQDLMLKAVGKKNKNPTPFKDRLHQSIQTAAGIEIEKDKFVKVVDKMNPATWFKGKKGSTR